MRWKGTKNPDVSRVLPLPQWFKGTEKSTRNVTFKWKSKQSLTLHARADFEKFIRSWSLHSTRLVEVSGVWISFWLKKVRLSVGLLKPERIMDTNMSPMLWPGDVKWRPTGRSVPDNRVERKCSRKRSPKRLPSCNKLYIGETGRRLGDRFREY